ncbi:hypothetical protein [Bacillus phage Nachito]|nr:hypothetical protein [Bacillus phage Nachito]
MAKMMIRLGGKWVDLGGIGGGADKEEILEEAAKYADELKKALDKDVKDLSTALGNTEDYIKGAFKDGIITEVEAAKISAYLNTLRLTKEDIDKRYDELYSNSWLPTERKKSIQSAKFNFDDLYNKLVTTIMDAIVDKKTTPEESAAVDKAFDDFNGALSLLSALLQIAIDEIGSAKAKQAEDNSKDYTDGLVGEVTRRVVQNESEIIKTNKEISLRVTREEFEEGILNVSTEATRFVVEQKKLFNEDLSNLNGKVQEGKDYTLEAFKDGIIYDAELAKIKEHLATINTAKTQFDARYDSIHTNEELPEDAKKNMEAAKTAFDANYNDLVTTINQVIADQKADPGEIQAVTNKFATFDNSTALLGSTIEVGIEAIGKVKQEKALVEAKKYADELKKETDKSLGDLQTNINNTEIYIKGAFHDGVITEMEAKKIEAYLNTLSESKAKMDAKYDEIYANTFLMGTPKLELYQRKADQQRAYDTLIKNITDAIADGKTTPTESNDVNMAFYDYNNAVTALSKAFEKAIDNIAQNKANKAEQNANDATDGKLAPMDTRIKSNTASIKTLADEINLRVTEEIFKKQIGDITEEMGGMETRVQKNEADIRVQADAINLRVTKETFDNTMLSADWYNQVKSSSPNMIGDWQNMTLPAPYEMVLTTLPDGSQGRAVRKIHVGGSTKIDNTGWMLPWIDVNPNKTYLLEFYVKAMDINSIYYYGREEAKADGTPNDQGNGPYIVGGRTPNEEDVKNGKWVKHFAVIPPHDAGETNSHVTPQSVYTPDHEDKFWNSESVKIQPKVYLTYNVKDISKNSEMLAWGFGLYEVGSVGNLFQSVTQAKKSADDAQKAADNAGKAAQTANESAVKANKLLDDISSDNKLTPMEKTELKREWDSLVAEKPSLEAEATLYKVGVEKTNYTAAYTDAEKFISPFIADLSTTQDVNGETLRTKTKALYTARSVLRQRISQIADEAAKAAADEAKAAKDLATGIGTKLDNMQVGGRNMELNTAANSGTWTNPGTTGYPQKNMNLAEYSKVLMRGKEVTISFKMKGKVTAFGTNNKYIGHEMAITFSDGTIGYYAARADTQVKLNTDYSLSTFSGTFTIPDKAITDVRAYALCRDLTGTVELSEYKIEIGNKATDWSPAPEDVAGQISNEVDNQVGSQMNGFNNLFNNSGNFKTLNGWIKNGGKSLGIVQKDGYSVLEAVGSISSTNTVTAADLKPSTEYVYSMEVKFSKDTPINLTTPMHFWFFDNGNNNGAFDSSVLISKDTVAKANTWTRISLKFKTKSTLSAAAYFRAFVYGTQLTDDNKYWVKNVMFSETNRAVAWTPSTWDIAELIKNSNTGSYNLLDGTAFDDMTPWTMNPTYASIENNIMPNGVKNGLLRVSGASGTYSDFTQRIPVEPDTEYTFSFNGGGTFSTFLWEKKADLTPTAVYTENKVNYAGKAFDMTSPRTDFVQTIRTQPDAAYIQVIFRVMAPASGSTSARFALAKLEKGSVATDWSPSINDIRNMVNLINVGGNNIIPNSLFKTQGKWRNWGTTGGTRTVGVAVDLAGFGTGFQFDAPAAGEYGYALDGVQLTQGETYTLSAWFKASKDGILKVQEGDSTVKWTFTSAPAVIGKWIRIVHTFVAKGNSTSIYIGQDGSSPACAGLATGVQLERGNKATDWSLATEDINELISGVDKKAQDSKDAIANMSSDSKLTPVEKVQLKKEWATMVAEKPQYESLATSFGITTEKTAYVTAYNTLNTVLNTTPGYLKDMQATNDINGATFRAQFDDYYDKKAQLIKKINETIQGNVNNINVGGRNLILNSSVAYSKTDYLINMYTIAEDWVAGQEYTFVVKGSVPAGQKFGVWMNGGSDGSWWATNAYANGVTYVTFKAVAPKAGHARTVSLYNAPQNTTQATVEWVALYKGNKPMDWSPAPEDITGLITNVDKKAQDSKDAIDNMSSDSKLTPVEKVQLKKEWAAMTAEKPQYEALANSFAIGTEKTNYVNAFNTLNTVLNTNPGYFKNMAATDTINGATFRAQFDDYYDRKAQLIKKINETIQGNVNNINVGGRNLLLGTKTPATIVGTNTSNQTFTPYFFAGGNSQAIINAPTFVFTFDWKLEGTAGGTLYVQGNNPYPGLSDKITFSSTNTSGHYSAVRSVSGSPFTGVNFRFDNLPVGTKVTISNAKIELGNKETDWSPAPEDIDQQMIDGVIYMRGTGLNHGGNRIMQISGKTIYDAQGRGLRLTAIRKSDLAVVFDQTYDVYASPSDPVQQQVADKINSLGLDVFIGLTSFDAIAVTKPELLKALQTIGGSGTPQNGRVPFALLGMKGLGTGAGIEVFGTTDKALSTNAEIFTRATNGVLQGVNSGTGAVADRVAKAEATISNLGDEINLRVKSTDFTGNTIASLINQTATTIKIKANQIQLEGYVTFDMIAGGTIKLGGANNINGKMEIFDKNGESVGLISAEDGGFSRLSVDYLTAQNVLQMTSQNHPNYTGGTIELWVDGENGNNNNSGKFGEPVRSIQEAINRLPKYLMHNVYIKVVPTFYSENLDIAGFKGVGGIYINSAHYNVRWMRLSTTGTITSAGAQGPTSLYVRTLAAYAPGGQVMPVSATSSHPAFTPDRGPQAAIDNNWDTYTDLYGGADGERRYITADLGKVYDRLESITFWLSEHGGQAATHKNVLLEVSTDNKTWRKIKEYPTWKGSVAGHYGHFVMTGKVTIRQCDDVVIDWMFNDFSYNNAGGAILESYSSKVIMRNCIMNGGPNNDNCVFAHHSDFEMNACEVNKSKQQLISCNYGTVATLTALVGGDAAYAYYAGTASHVSGWGSVPWGNSGYGQATGGGILNGEWSNDNRKRGDFTAAPPPPPPPQYQTITRQWQSYHCDSYGYFLGSSRWKPDEDVPLQGKWGDYGQWKGCWFFPDEMWNTIYASNVTEIQSVRVWVGRINGAGNAGDTMISVRTHPHQYKPAGDPSMSGGVDNIWLPRGGGAWVTLTGNNMDNFRINSKWAKGIAVYAASDNSTYYAKMQNECYVEVTYKVKV